MGRTRRIALACFRSGTNPGKYSRDSGSKRKRAIRRAYFLTEPEVGHLYRANPPRDTLSYLEQRVSTLLGRKEAIVSIHGGMGREERTKMQEAFKHDPDVQVLIATDAAGEGINLQRAHLMVNYDLPWNPNRIEQRFGRGDSTSRDHGRTLFYQLRLNAL